MIEKLSLINVNWWNNIANKVKNSIVFIDDGAAECLHWNGGILKLLDGGAITVLHFSTSQTVSALCQKNETTRCVFILTDPLWSDTLETLELILSCRVFTECVIITSINPAVHHLAKYGSRSSAVAMPKDDPFIAIKNQLLNTMGNKKYSIDVIYIPAYIIQICPNFFLTPAYAQLFPVFSSTAGSNHLNKSFDTMADITFDDLKIETQVQLRGLAFNLDALFEAMNLREDCYSIGCFSRITCSELEQLSSSKLRKKKAGTRTSVILLDRTLDLSQATSYEFETLMDKIMHLMPKLPHHQTDVQIDLSSLCSVHQFCVDADVLISGSLSGSENQDYDTLNAMVNDRQKDCIMRINRKLVDACTKEQLSLGSAGRMSRITTDTLLSKIANFKSDLNLLSNYHCLLQHSLATAKALQEEEKTKIDQLLGVEKALTQMLAESQSVNIALRLAQVIKERKTRSLSMEEILIILIRICAMKNIFKDTNESEEILKAVVGDAMLHDYTELPSYLKSAIGLEVDEYTVHTATARFFQLLHAISATRGDLKKYKSIYDPGNSAQPAVCVPLIKQLLDDIYDPTKPDLVDLECKSTGIKDMLKSGLSLFLNVNKPRPADCQILIIYVVGGITATEVRYIKEQIAHHSPNTEVIVGSTRLALPKDNLNLILSDLNYML